MSVAVLPIQPSYIEPYVQNKLMTALLDSDSDAGYGTPTENLFPAVQREKVRDGEPVSESTTAGVAAADSSSDSDEGEICQVDEELQDKIIKQVEWYFSDENLLKDSFLMKHISRNKQGYVSLKLVASLRKVKALSKDWKAVLASLRLSILLELNEEETKIRRKAPVPKVDFSHISKTLIITEHPEEEPNLANLEQEFGRYGEVTQVRLIHPGRAIPLDVKPCKTHHPSLGKELCILVEFVNEDVARAACRKVQLQQSWRDEMKVQLLGEKEAATGDSGKALKNKTKTKAQKPPTEVHSTAQKPGQSSGKATYSIPPPLHASSQSGGTPTTSRHTYERKNSPPSGPHSHSTEKHRYKKLRGGKCSPDYSRKFLHPESWRDNAYTSDSGLSCSGLSCGTRSPSESPRMTPEPSRKFFSSSITEHSWRSADRQHSHLNSCVIRQPLGPDGTKGFARHRVSPVSVAVQSC